MQSLLPRDRQRLSQSWLFEKVRHVEVRDRFPEPFVMEVSLSSLALETCLDGRHNRLERNNTKTSKDHPPLLGVLAVAVVGLPLRLPPAFCTQRLPQTEVAGASSDEPHNV